MSATIFDERNCGLGEGPFWHPIKQQLFWFDIHAYKLYSRSGDKTFEWDLGEHASAAGWVDRDTLLVATETGLYRYGLTDYSKMLVVELEADTPQNRANDGRADPHGGFWIGTMGKMVEENAGALYRYYRGELRKLLQPMTTPNAICFARSGELAYFTDSQAGVIMQQNLDSEGWPKGEPRAFLDLGKTGVIPDGAVVDATGNIWVAQWDAGRVACFTPEGVNVENIDLPVKNTTCPAFGGSGYSTIFITSAWGPRKGKDDCKTFSIEVDAVGLPECRVDLG